jgi:hypothetical protein
MKKLVSRLAVWSMISIVSAGAIGCATGGIALIGDLIIL